MYRLFPLLFLLFTAVFPSAVWAQSAREVAQRADSVDPADIRRCKDRVTSVLGRVMQTRELGDMTCLIMDGGALHISVPSEKDAKWEGKLIESTGMIEATPPAKAGQAELPPFRMIQLSKRGIRFIKETPESVRSVLIQKQKPVEGSNGRLEPPGARPDPTALEASAIPFTRNQTWTRNNGQKATVAFTGWRYRERTAPDRKASEWVVEMYVLDSSPPAYYLPEDLDLSPPEAERLRIALWKAVGQKSSDQDQKGNIHPSSEAAMRLSEQNIMPTPEQELADTVAWEEKLKTWGETPFKPETRQIYRLPGPADFGNVPDLRQPTVVKLLKPSLQGRREGTLVLLDWAMTGEPSSTKVTAKVRWSDGMEDTVRALYLAPDIIIQTRNGSGNFTKFDSPLIFLKDWLMAKQRKEILPGAELKIRAMRQLLRVWWNGRAVAVNEPTGPTAIRHKAAETAIADAKKQEEARKPFRHGLRLSFPGLPPEGFMPVSKPDPDRSLMLPMPSDKAAFVRESNAVAHTVIFSWWDATGVLPLPEKNGLSRSQEALFNHFKRSNTGSLAMDEYATKFLDGKNSFQMTDDVDFSPANLSRYATGPHAVMLAVRMWDGRQTDFTQQLAVVTVTPQGAITFCAWGRKVEGVMKVTELHGKSKRPSSAPKFQQESYEIEISNPPEIQELLKQKGLRVVLDDWQGSLVTVITPYAKDPAAAPPAGAKGGKKP
jgi:hypothetical protein